MFSPFTSSIFPEDIFTPAAKILLPNNRLYSKSIFSISNSFYSKVAIQIGLTRLKDKIKYVSLIKII